MHISEIRMAPLLPRDEACVCGSIDKTENTWVRSKQERAEAWNGRWKIYVDSIDSQSAWLADKALWKPSGPHLIGFHTLLIVLLSFNLTLKWMILFRCCKSLLNRPKKLIQVPPSVLSSAPIFWIIQIAALLFLSIVQTMKWILPQVHWCGFGITQMPLQ